MCSIFACCGMSNRAQEALRAEGARAARVEAAEAAAARILRHLVKIEDIARFKNDEMKATINALSSGVSQSQRLVYHFTSKKTAGFILEGHGVRASTEEDQLGGGLSVCKAPPHEMGWEQYGGPTWREGVGRKLWGEKWENVLMGHEDADKLEVVIVAKIPALVFNDISCARSLRFRTCMPFLDMRLFLTLHIIIHFLPFSPQAYSIRSPVYRMPHSMPPLPHGALYSSIPLSQPKHTPMADTLQTHFLEILVMHMCINQFICASQSGGAGARRRTNH